jgi:hypothetical protein
MQTIQKESLQEARQRLLENAGPDALYEIDPYRAYERLQKQYSQDWRVFTGFTAIVFSFAASGGLLAVALPFLIGACTLEKALLYSPVLGIFGALSAIVTHITWACLANSKLPQVSKLSLTLFASMSSACIVFGNTYEASPQNKIDCICVLTFLAFCIIPGLCGSALVLATKTKKIKNLIGKDM